ncbi:MAG: NTP transferase domain-containing protein [Phycisphaerales bacterium]|nr:NTP transferase domain-containing protein [Phycisphaerales bacterium]
MGSSRLPGKALLEIGGCPLVARICRRVALAETVTESVVVTTEAAGEAPMLQQLDRMGIGAFQGSTDDLVVRFHDAALRFNADVIVRIWGDCPFVDPAVIDMAVRRLRDDGLDYCATFSPTRRTFPGGLDLEVYRVTTLERIRTESDDPFYREFPADYLQANTSSFAVGSVEADADYSKFNLTIDYPEDLELARAIYDRLEHGKDMAAAADFHPIVDLLEQEPVLLALDQGQARNAEYLSKLEEMGE